MITWSYSSFVFTPKSIDKIPDEVAKFGKSHRSVNLMIILYRYESRSCVFLSIDYLACRSFVSTISIRCGYVILELNNKLYHAINSQWKKSQLKYVELIIETFKMENLMYWQFQNGRLNMPTSQWWLKYYGDLSMSRLPWRLLKGPKWQWKLIGC